MRLSTLTQLAAVEGTGCFGRPAAFIEADEQAMIMVHPMARPTPRTRAEIHESTANRGEIAQTYNICRSTARKWRNRSDHLDRSHRALQMNITLSPAQELIVLEIRRLCLLPQDDLVCVVHGFISTEASRSSISRLLRREGLSKQADLVPQQDGQDARKHKTSKDYEPGYVHIDIKYLPQMPDETSRRYLFVAIDRATRWAFLRIYYDQTERSNVDFSDNGTQFNDRFTSKNRQPTHKHVFDEQCNALNIEHRLSPPKHPQTNGMVERFNGRISEVVKQTRFASGGAELEATLNNYMLIYNHHIPQRSLGHTSPVDVLKSWQDKKPELILKRVYKLAALEKIKRKNFYK